MEQCMSMFTGICTQNNFYSLVTMYHVTEYL